MKRGSTKLEKFTSFAVITGSLIGIGWLATKFIGVLLSGITPLLTIGGIIALLLMFRNGKVRTACWNAHQTIIRKGVGLFVTANKLEIIKNYLDYMKDKSDELDKHTTTFKANLKNLIATINKLKKERQEYAETAHHLKTENKTDDPRFSRSVARMASLDSMIKKYVNMYQNELFLFKKFAKMYKVSAMVIENTEYDIKLQTEEYKAIKQHHKAMKAGLGALGADKNKKSMYEDAVDKMQEEISKKASEIDTFMDLTSQIVADADMKTSIQESKGVKMLEDWENNGGFGDIASSFGKKEEDFENETDNEKFENLEKVFVKEYEYAE